MAATAPVRIRPYQPAFVTLHTGAANQPTRSLYRQLGYREEELMLTKPFPAAAGGTGGCRRKRASG